MGTFHYCVRKRPSLRIFTYYTRNTFPHIVSTWAPLQIHSDDCYTSNLPIVGALVNYENLMTKVGERGFKRSKLFLFRLVCDLVCENFFFPSDFILVIPIFRDVKWMALLLKLVMEFIFSFLDWPLLISGMQGHHRKWWPSLHFGSIKDLSTWPQLFRGRRHRIEQGGQSLGFSHCAQA